MKAAKGIFVLFLLAMLLNVFLGIVVSLVLGGLGWFLFNLIFSFTESGFFEIVKWVYIAYMGWMTLVNVVTSTRSWLKVKKTALRIGMTPDEVLGLMAKYKLQKEKPLTEWTAEWVQEQISEQEEMKELLNTLLKGFKL